MPLKKYYKGRLNPLRGTTPEVIAAYFLDSKWVPDRAYIYKQGEGFVWVNAASKFQPTELQFIGEFTEYDRYDEMVRRLKAA